MVVGLTRIRKNGKATYILLTPEMKQHTGWREGDRLVVRPVGDKLLLERLPLEQLAKLTSLEMPNAESER